MKFKVVKTSVTEREALILRAIEDADHSTDGNGLQGHLEHDEWDMKIYRGVISSLIKKGIIEAEQMSFNEMFGDGHHTTWCSVNSKYQIEDASNDWSGYEYQNIEFPKGSEK